MWPISDEASRGLSTSVWNLQTGLQTLAATKEVPRHTCLQSRGSTRVPPHPEEPRFHLMAREEGSFHCVVGKEFPAFPSHLKRRRSPQERREELQCRATIPRVPQMSQSIPGKPVFPALPRLSSRGSTHTTVARGTSLWANLVGKPRGKASRERHRSLDPRKGKRDTAAKLGRKAHVHAPTRDEDLRLWGDSRSPGRSMSALERNPQVPALTPHKVLGPGIDGRGIPRGPRATRMGTGLS